jgi:hypothetical protein
MRVQVWTEKIDGSSDKKAKKENGCQEAEGKRNTKRKAKGKREPMTVTETDCNTLDSGHLRKCSRPYRKR